MVFERWDLGFYKDRLRAEFGFENKDAFNELIRQKVNDAQKEVIRRRPNWPWQRRTSSLDIGSETTVTVAATEGSRTITGAGITPSLLRKVLNEDTTSIRKGGGYLVVAASNGTATLESQWLGETNAAISLVAREMHFELPDGAITVDTAAPVRTVEDRYFTYANASSFERNRRAYYSHSLDVSRVYTVWPDPAGISGRYFLSIFPPITERTSIAVTYFATAPELVLDSDEPILPINDRPVLFMLAAKLIALARSDPRLETYSHLSNVQIEQMTLRIELATDQQLEDNTNPLGPVFYDYHNTIEFGPPTMVP